MGNSEVRGPLARVREREGRVGGKQSEAFNRGSWELCEQKQED